MGKGRLEAFSDGVLAIIITIMVLEIKVPHGVALLVLKPLLPVLLSYILSFVYIGIYWNNHHHMMHTANQVNGAILWANMHLLFWLSLIPFSSGWMGENHFAKWPVILYGVNLIMCAIAYSILSDSLVKLHGTDSTLAKVIGKGTKGKVSIALYFAGIVSTFFHPMLGMAMYTVVAGIWFIPDKRIEVKVKD
ncbi:MAG: DUF1211 domain-containing protein [Ferruginibacter sp.]|nr:DUF1211 domain-containing protein [Ferruginibacter sp.]